MLRGDNMTHIIIPEQHQAAPHKHELLHIPTQDYIRIVQGLGQLGVLKSGALDEGLEVRPSRIHGLGLYATTQYNLHDVIWRESLQGGNIPEDDGPLRWTNHSDDPNTALVLKKGLEHQLEVMLVSLKPISADEEITYDYNVFGHTGYGSACNCGNENCTGVFALRTEWGEKR